MHKVRIKDETVATVYLCLSEDERRSQSRPYVSNTKNIKQTDHDDVHWRVTFGNRIVDGCRRAGPDSEPIQYLIGRSIDPTVIDPDVILYHPNLFHSNAEPRSFSAMVVKARDANWNVVGLQRTYLQDGKKAPVATAKLSWRMCPKPLRGIVWLTKPNTKIIAAKGFEDSGSALMARQDWGAVATLGTSGFRNMEVPDDVETVILCGDNDPSGASVKAILAAAQRLSSAGISVLICFPPPGVKDFNQLLQEQGLDAVRSCLDDAEEYVPRAMDFRSKPKVLQKDQRLRKKIHGLEMVPSEKAPARSRLLKPGQVSQAVRSTLKTALDAGFNSRRLAPYQQTAHVVRIGAGSGKSQNLLEGIAKHPELKTTVPMPTGKIDQNGNSILEERQLPIFVALPMHKLSAEMLKSAHEYGLRAMVFSGKETNCGRQKDVAELHNAHLSSAGLCVDPQDKTKICDLYEWCQYQKMKREIAEHDVVFVAHNWLTITPPIIEMATPRFVVIDESFWESTIRTSSMPLDTLAMDRVTGKDAKTLSEKVRLQHKARKTVAETALRALEDGKCPAEAILNAQQEDLVDLAKRAAGGSDFGTEPIHPGLTSDDIKRIASNHQFNYGRAEAAFWRTIKARIEEIKQHQMLIQMGAGDRVEPLARNLNIRVHKETINTVYGEIINGTAQQVVKKTPVRTVRTSYRADLNWSDVSTVVIDAHANELITQAMWPSRKLHWHRVEADLNAYVIQIADHSYSNSSVVLGPKAGEKRMREAAMHLHDIRKTISTLAGQHKRLLVTPTKKIKKAITSGWKVPKNVCLATMGALRGLDKYKTFEAVLVVGRLQLPSIAIDDSVAALWNGQGPTPEWLDPGNGEDNSIPWGESFYHMRSGETLRTRIQMAPHELQQAILEQRRECELEQAIARLRLIYREIPGYVYLMTNVPTSILVDEIISVQDLTGNETPLMKCMRVGNGILFTNPDLLCTLPETPFKKPEDARNALRAANLTLASLTAAANAATAGTLAGNTRQDFDSIAEKGGKFPDNHNNSDFTTLSMDLITVTFRWEGMKGKATAALMSPTLAEPKAALRAALSQAGKKLDEASFQILLDPSAPEDIIFHDDDEAEDAWLLESSPTDIEERLERLEIDALSQKDLTAMQRTRVGRKACEMLDSWSEDQLRALAATITSVADQRDAILAQERERLSRKAG